MTQHPYDQLSKQLLEELLAPLGTVQRSLEIPGEAKYVDLWFLPNPTSTPSVSSLLEKIAQTPCLLEPYRNPPTRNEIWTCLLKLRWVQDNLRRQTQQKPKHTPPHEQLMLWIIATSITQPMLSAFGAQPKPEWEAGISFAAAGFGTAFISIEQLPKTRPTLILRLLANS